MNLAFGKHSVDALECLAGLCKNHHACSWAVKSVSHTEEHVARLLISLLDESFQSLAERFITRLIALHNLMASLADHNEMIVFVYYLHY